MVAAINNSALEVEVLVREALEGYTKRFAVGLSGVEQIGVTALVRALDMAAVLNRFAHLDVRQAAQLRSDERFFILQGAAPALKPLLAKVANISGGLSWQSSDPRAFRTACTYLHGCGQLAYIARTIASQRYGLASIRKTSANEFDITVVQGRAESVARQEQAIADDQTDNEFASETASRLRAASLKRMRRYVYADVHAFIGYDNDWGVVADYLGEAQAFGRRFPEGESLPKETVVCGRPFGAWKHACDQALGRILCHADFCSTLRAKMPTVEEWNTLTMFARNEDLMAVWSEAGMPNRELAGTLEALTLDPESIEEWIRNFEVPTCFYIRIGKEFSLLPLFGGMMNPYYSLFRHLRKVHRKDWDRGVDSREHVFRSDLAAVLPQSRFVVPPTGYKLRRQDGSVLTDIDAVAVDDNTGTLALFQLKWHDPFGFSLSERESRKLNIAKAIDWVQRVRQWVGDSSSREVCERLGIVARGDTRPPVVFVLARYNARFTGDRIPRGTATWLSWAEFSNALRSASPTDPLRSISIQSDRELPHTTAGESWVKTFNFPGFRVRLQSEIGPEAPATSI